MARVSLEEKLRTVQRERLALEEDIQKVRLTAFFGGSEITYYHEACVLCVCGMCDSMDGCVSVCARVCL